MQKRIENVERYSMQQNDGTTVHFAIVRYQTGQEKVFLVPGECVAYVETGFVVSDDKSWLFYDESGNKISEQPKSKLGKLVEAASDSCYRFYQSEKGPQVLNDTFFFVTSRGEQLWNQQTLSINIPAEQEFEDRFASMSAEFAYWPSPVA